MTKDWTFTINLYQNPQQCQNIEALDVLDANKNETKRRIMVEEVRNHCTLKRTMRDKSDATNKQISIN